MRKLLAGLVLVAGILAGLFISAPPASASTMDWHVFYGYYYGAPHTYTWDSPSAHHACSAWGPCDTMFIFQTDGNLVLYTCRTSCGTKVVWASGTAGIPRPARLVWQADGNLVIYDYYNRARWATGTNRGSDIYDFQMWTGTVECLKDKKGNSGAWPLLWQRGWC